MFNTIYNTKVINGVENSRKMSLKVVALTWLQW